MAEAPEPLRVDRGFVIVDACDRREGDRAVLFHATSARDVHQDAEQPRLDARTALEPVDALDHREPRLLHDLFGDRLARDVLRREANERAVIAIEQERERVGVASGEAP